MYNERKTHVVIDELGIDPLLDKSWDAILSIPSYSNYTVKQDEAKNAPLIAHRTLGNYKNWWIIQVYNGIGNTFEITEGMVLKIPSGSEVISRLTDSTVKKSKTTVKI